MPIIGARASRLLAAIVMLVLLLAPLAAARAQEIKLNGFAEFGLAMPANQRSWAEGGFGRLGFGNGGQDLVPRGQAAVDVRLELDPALIAFASLRVAPDQHAPFDILEAYARYQPVATPSRLWSVKLGAFFPPISLENESVGWTSPWTLTPSAINSWVGDELRTIGAESTVEWRYEAGALGLAGSVFGWNQPNGTVLADRGWAFDDRPIGLLGGPRRPDAVARRQRQPLPLREQPFQQLDGEPGWYAGASWRHDEIGRVTALYYDNRANPALFSGSDFGWRTRFTSLGLESGVGDIVILSQAMLGSTIIAPRPTLTSVTDFQSAYLLAGYYIRDFRLAGRIDAFATQQHTSASTPQNGEHGYALTLAGTWTPYRWLRLTAELMRVESYRSVALSPGTPPGKIGATQLQLVSRIFF